jgi:hypothetical protein
VPATGRRGEGLLLRRNEKSPWPRPACQLGPKAPENPNITNPTNNKCFQSPIAPTTNPYSTRPPAISLCTSLCGQLGSRFVRHQLHKLILNIAQSHKSHLTTIHTMNAQIQTLSCFQGHHIHRFHSRVSPPYPAIYSSSFQSTPVPAPPPPATSSLTSLL